MDDDLNFKHPFTCIISGPSGSNKSSFCIRFLQILDSLRTEKNFNGRIICCYRLRTAVTTEQLTILRSNIRFNEGVPENFEYKNCKPCLIILDDLLNDVYFKEVCNLFTKGNHHRSFSVILFTQNFFHHGRFCRNVSLNAKIWYSKKI